MKISAIILINGVEFKDEFEWNGGADYIKFETKWAKIAQKHGGGEPLIFINFNKEVPLNF